MFKQVSYIGGSLSAVLIAAVLLAPVSASAQGLVPIGSLTGGSSVFVFRNTAKAKRVTVAVKPTRSKAQLMETASKIKKQYETIAKTTPHPNRAKVVEPNKLPASAERSLPPAQASKLFAGVGEYYLQNGDFEQSFEFFTTAIRLDDTNLTAKAGYSEALSTKGNELLVKDQAATAKGLFLEALKFNSNNSAAYFGLGEVYSELDQTAEAIASYENSLKNDKNLTEIYVPLGILYYQTGEIAKADELLTKALANSSASAETQFFLGLVRSSQNRNEDALAAFQKAASLDPTYAEAFFNSGEMLVRLKRAGDAVVDYKKAVALKAGYFDAWLALGEAQYELGNYEEAVTAYKTASKLKNTNWEALAGLGEAYRQTKKFEDAEASYNLAALFYTQNKDYDKNVAADLYSKIGLVIGQQCDINMQRNVVCKWPTAIRNLQKAVDLTGNPIDNVNLGWAYFRSAHPDAEAKNMAAARPNLELAQAALQKAVSAGGPAADFGLQNLASVQIDLGDYKSAITTLTTLVSNRPDLDFSMYALGVAYFKTADFANAEKWMRSAVDKQPQNVSYLMGLGESLIARKNKNELKKVIDRVKAIDGQRGLELDIKRQRAGL